MKRLEQTINELISSIMETVEEETRDRIESELGGTDEFEQVSQEAEEVIHDLWREIDRDSSPICTEIKKHIEDMLISALTEFESFESAYITEYIHEVLTDEISVVV